MKCLSLVLALTMFSALSFAADDAPLPRARLQTSFGDIVVELEQGKAPRTVENFLAYARDGAYDGTIFHRVIKDFMVQGGGFTAQYEQRKTRPPIPIESNNGLKNKRGTLAMARTIDPNSATNQFFINVVNNPSLDHHSPKAAYWGYTVFGRVVEGMDVVDRIRAVRTGAGGQFPSDVPQTQVIINRVKIESPAPPTAVEPEKKGNYILD